MNLLIVIWSMIAAMCAMLGMIQLLLWSNSPRELAFPLTALMSFAAAATTIIEMYLFSTASTQTSEVLLFWANNVIAVVVVSLVWAMRAYLPRTRGWLAWLITALWTAGILVNVFMPGNLTWTEITNVQRLETFWGQAYYFPSGTINPWKWLADVTVLLIPVFILDGAFREWKQNRRSGIPAISFGATAFIVIGGVQAMLIDAGIVEMPSMIGAGFLVVVFTLTWSLVKDGVQARELRLAIAESRRETEQLMRTNLLGEISASLAHDLNQPLSAILGNAQAAQRLIKRDPAPLDELEDILTDIVRDDKRARDIIISMRQIIRGDEEDDQPQILGREVKEALKLLHDEIEEHQVTVNLQINPQIPPVSGGKVSLQQVALNLLLNAIHAVEHLPESRRRIDVNIESDGVLVTMNIRDHGEGIPEDQLDRIFEPFFSTKQAGMGIGLAICRRIVESRAGILTAKNAEEGGAHFTLSLPVWENA